MLQKLRTSYLLSAELSETFSKYMEAVEKVTVTEPFVAKVTGLLKGNIADLDEAIAKLKTDQLIEPTAAADEDRYDLLIGFRNQVLVGKRRKNPAMQSASDRVFEVITNAGLRSSRYGYTQTSGKFRSLFGQLDQPEFQEDLQLLNAADIYAELKAAESEFLSIYATRASSATTAADVQLDELRSKVVVRGTAFLNIVELLEELEPETFSALSGTFNFITSKIMATARARRTRLENGLSDDDSNADVAEGEQPASDDAIQRTAINSI